MSYADKLPRKTRRRIQCSALLDNGNRCPRTAVEQDYFHANPEHGRRADWVVVSLCSDHAESRRG